MNKILFSLMMLLFCNAELLAKDLLSVELRVTEPYLELHTGPSSEYRIEHVLLSGEKIQVKKQYADWFYLQQSEKVYGWAPLNTLLDNRVDRFDMSFDEFLINFEGDLDFDVSFSGGFIEGDFLLGIGIGQLFDENLRAALNIRRVPGKISESNIFTLDLDYIFKKWRGIVPYASIGIGQLVNTPSPQVIGGEKVSSELLKAGFGIVFAESKRISFSAGMFVYFPDNEAFEKVLQETSISMSYYY